VGVGAGAGVSVGADVRVSVCEFGRSMFVLV